MAPLKVYSDHRSPPSQAVILLINYLGLEYEKIDVDVVKGEQLKDWFLKLNPRHEVPVLDDNGFVISESRAILTYLANSRVPRGTLYAMSPKKRAVVDSRLYYDATTFFNRVNNALEAVLHSGAKKVSLKEKTDIIETLIYLNDILRTEKFVAGRDISIADFSILPTMVSLFYMGIKVEEYRYIQRWYQLCKILPGFAELEDGMQALASLSNEVVDGDTVF